MLVAKSSKTPSERPVAHQRPQGVVPKAKAASSEAQVSGKGGLWSVLGLEMTPQPA
jgi:hypothetical protein